MITITLLTYPVVLRDNNAPSHDTLLCKTRPRDSEGSPAGVAILSCLSVSANIFRT